MGWVMEVVLGGRKMSLMDFEGAIDVGMGSAVVQDKGHLTFLYNEDSVLLVKPGTEEVASHPGLLVGVVWNSTGS